MKPCKLCEKQRYGTSSWCRSHFFERERAKKEAKKLKKKEKRENNTKRLKKVLDKVISEYVRRRGAVKGLAQCVSCGKKDLWQNLQCGHYISRKHFNTRYDLRNLNVQCVICNIFNKGNYPLYTKYLLFTYGQEWLEKLIEDGWKLRRWTAPELKAEIEKYKALIANL